MLVNVSKASGLFIATISVTLLSQLFVAGYLLSIFSAVEDAQQLSARENENLASQSAFIKKLQTTIGHSGHIHNDISGTNNSAEMLEILSNNINQLMVLREKISAIVFSTQETNAISEIYQTVELYLEKLDTLTKQENLSDQAIYAELAEIDDNKAYLAMELLSNNLADRELQHINYVEGFMNQSNRDLQYGLFVVGLLFLQTLVLLFSFYKLTLQNKKMNISLRYLNSFIDESPEAMVVINANGEITKANNAAALLLGYEDHELLLLPFERLLPKEFQHGFQMFRQSLIVEGTKPKGDKRRSAKISKKNGDDIDIECSFSRLKNAPYLILNIRDVTIQKLAEKSAMKSQRMDAIGQLTAGVAHDFNNILASIMGNTECAELFIEDKAQAEQHLNLVKKAVDRASSLTSQLLAFSRKQPLQHQQLMVSDVVEDMADILKSILGRSIELSISIEEASWPVVIDKVQLETAIINLCLNAKQAMTEGGRLSVEVENVTLEQTFNKERRGSSHDYVKIIVADTGHGIPEAIKHKVVEPFFTTKIKGQASGLGLSMVFGFITQSQGNLQIDSEEGQGTSITLFIPRLQNSTPAERPFLSTPGRTKNRGNNVLVVEDDDEVRKISTLILSQQGYRVLEAASPDEALVIAKSEPLINLIFSDVILSSDMNGIELSALLLKQHSDAKLILTTGYMDEISLADNNIPADTPILKKPYNRQQLLQLVSDIMAGESKKLA